VSPEYFKQPVGRTSRFSVLFVYYSIAAREKEYETLPNTIRIFIRSYTNERLGIFSRRRSIAPSNNIMRHVSV